MLVLKRLIAFVVTSVTVLAGGAVAVAATGATGQPTPWQLGLQRRRHRGDGQHHLVPRPAAVASSRRSRSFVLALLVIVMVKFNARSNPVPSRTTHNTVIEVVWTVVPVLILVAIAVPSFRLLFLQLNDPAGRPDRQGDRQAVVLELQIPGRPSSTSTR